MRGGVCIWITPPISVKIAQFKETERRTSGLIQALLTQKWAILAKSLRDAADFTSDRRQFALPMNHIAAVKSTCQRQNLSRAGGVIQMQMPPGAIGSPRAPT